MSTQPPNTKNGTDGLPEGLTEDDLKNGIVRITEPTASSCRPQEQDDFDVRLADYAEKVDTSEHPDTTVRLAKWQKNSIGSITVKADPGTNKTVAAGVMFGLDLAAGTIAGNDDTQDSVTEQLLSNEVERIREIVYELNQIDAREQEALLTPKQSLLDERRAATEPIPIWLPESYWGRLSDYVTAAGLKQSSVIRHLIAIALARSDHTGDNTSRAVEYEEQFVQRVESRLEEAEWRLERLEG